MAQKNGGKVSDNKKTRTATNKTGASAARKNTASKKAAGASVKNNESKGSNAVSDRKSSQSDKIKKNVISNEVKGILIIACGFFLLFAFLTDSAGAVGAMIKKFFYGLLGVSGAISCVFIILTGINVFINKREDSNKKRIFLLLGIMLSTSVLTALITGDIAFIDGAGIAEQITSLYRNGMQSQGGGLLGGSLCKILVNLIGVTGTWIMTAAVELILFILLTGVSLKTAFQKITGLIGKKPQKSDTDGKITNEGKRPKTDLEDSPQKRKSSKFFDGYFSGEEQLPENDYRESLDGIKEQTRKEDGFHERFELKEDDELLSKIIPQDRKLQKDMEAELPFCLDNMKTGTISELPVTAADGSVAEKENPEDEDPVFTPPTEAKLEDVLDPLTQKAVKAGMPLDRAVDAGRRMAADSESEELTPEEDIGNQVAAAAAMPPRIIQYHMPILDLLDRPKPKTRTRSEVKHELEEKANRLLDTLRSFKVEAKIINITQGPSVTRFELQPGFGVKVSKITSLTDDIALSLAAPGVRIEAPIPGKSAVGIEIPNRVPSPVPIREVLESDKFMSFQSKTAFALGKDIAGSCVVADIAKFPHVLIAGQTGSGKSVCINSLILSILYKARPDEVKLIMVDPKMVELGIYNGIPHLLIPVVTDPKHAAGALNWAVTEMQNRYNLLRDNNVRNLKGFNALMEERGEPESKLPEIVIIIDEFADLMIAAKSEVENAINRLAALARAAGMYLVIATQRPTVNVITGVIKANIPSRIAFNVTSQVDSRTILDAPGADKLMGKGDMLYNPSGAVKPMRIQGNFVSDAEIERVIEFIKSQYEADYDAEIIENIQKEQEKVTANLEGTAAEDGGSGGNDRMRSGENRDELFIQAVEMVVENGQASVAMFQRRFKIGYQRAARLIDQMEESRIIGPYEGTKPRQVLISRQEFLEMKMNEKS